MDLCKFCGAELVDGTCPNGHELKKMCINCGFCKNDGDTLLCQNDENESDAIAKIKAAAEAAAGGYEIGDINIELKPLVIKKPSAKCKRWELDTEVLEVLKKIFV